MRRFTHFLRKCWNSLPGRRFDIASAFDEASRLMMEGDRHAAILVFREIVKAEPTNVAALSDLSALLSDIGQNAEAKHLFELACALDDSYIPVILNHAKLLTDERRSMEAMPLLERAKAFDPHYAYTDSVYQSRLFQFGHTDTARIYQLKSWLAAFDRLRMANGQLFSSCYADIDEAEMAAEHLFWAETLKPIVDRNPTLQSQPRQQGGRIRIGYLSPDFRNHAVRYFFRPLLENHDKTRFEVFLFHDFGPRDWQTDLIQSKAEHFICVHEMSDDKLARYIRDQCLDILVDLCGHTSYNRIDLFQRRLATVQINALGYPPTTGLKSMDYKLVDKNIITPQYLHYYTERPLILPTSFWCFDPMEDAPLAQNPPSASGAPVIFGCFGNICKITNRMLQAWVKILAGVPGSMLRVRSVNFQDENVISDFQRRVVAAGFDITHVDLSKPLAGEAFWNSYNEVDIILDTFPFCGGTTTSFAVYMGVPVVTLAGNSLTSRMGLSIMRNAGGESWIAVDFQEYVEKAIQLAYDSSALLQFKRESRYQMKTNALGSGELFAKEFESACEVALQERLRGKELEHHHQVPLLDATEIHRRAYHVLVTGQPDAASRILRHGLTHYPASAGLNTLYAQLIVDSEGVDAAIQYLEPQLQTFASKDLAGPLMFLAGLKVQKQDTDGVRSILARLSSCVLNDCYDISQFALYEAWLAFVDGTLISSNRASSEPTNKEFIHETGQQLSYCVLICGEVDKALAIQQAYIDKMQEGVMGLPECPTLEWRHTTLSDRAKAFDAAARGGFDAVIVLHCHISSINPRWIFDVAEGLRTAEVIGFMGSRRADRLDWRADDFSQKAGSFLRPGLNKQDNWELLWYGSQEGPWTTGMQILDGAFFACRTQAALKEAMDEELIGEQTLAEEEWVLRVAKSGGRVVVGNALGFVVGDASNLDRSNRAEARLHFVNKHQIDVFGAIRDDYIVAMVPVHDLSQGLAIAQKLSQLPS